MAIKKNFNDGLNKLNKTTQDTVINKAQEKVTGGYDSNKITNHMRNNFSTNTPNNGSLKNTLSINPTIITNTTPKHNANNVNIGSDYKPQERGYDLGQTRVEQGLNKNRKPFDMTNSHIAQRGYMDIVEKKRQKEGFPKNASRTGNISKYIMPNRRGGFVEMTEEEHDNMPSTLNPKEQEKIKYITNDRLRKGNNNIGFENYWNKIKDEKEKIPDEVKEMTEEKFNDLNDEDKLRLYKAFNQKQRKDEEKQNEQNLQEAKTKKQNISKVVANGEGQEDIETQTFETNGNSDDKDDIRKYSLKLLEEDFNKGNIDELGARKKIEEVKSSITAELGEKSDLTNGDLARIDEWLVEGYTGEEIINAFVNQDDRFKNGSVYKYDNPIEKEFGDKYVGTGYNFQLAGNYKNGVVNQENINNILKNKEGKYLEEVKMYPNGDTTKEPRIMYQVWDKNDKKIEEINNYEKDYRGQCTYFVSKVVNDKYGDKTDYFEVPHGADAIIGNCEDIKDKDGNQLFELTSTPTVGSIYCKEPNKNEKGERVDFGHVAIVKSVKEIQTENGIEYEVTLLEQNNTIKVDGVEYKPAKGNNRGNERVDDADYSMVVGESKVRINPNNSNIQFMKSR